jgi:hypothetical protein
VYSIGDLEEMTVQTRRTLQFWVESGALKPTPETSYMGRGVHRVFDASEAVIGLLLAAISQNTWPIGRLIRMAEAIRALIETDEKFRNYVNQAIAGQVALFLVLDWSFDIGFLVDPTPDEVFKFTVAKLEEDNHRGLCTKVVVFVTPWLARARSPLP